MTKMIKPTVFDSLSVMAKDEVALTHAQKRGSLTDNSRRRFSDSAQTVVARTLGMPRVTYDQDLPISKHVSEIERLLKKHQVVIVAGETGSGKTTQIPLACLRAGLGIRGMIAHTQPRRLAARAVASRIADQLGVNLGDEVGFAVRFNEKWGKSTYVKVMTDGLLLTEIRSDRFLNAYDCVIIDEAHERSLNIDFLIGYLRRLIEMRPNLRVIVTSATIDVDSFSKHFNDAPIVQVEGRGYPVEVLYREPNIGSGNAVIECLQEICDSRSGTPKDVLMFLASEREILEWSLQVRKHFHEEFEVIPLYARLPPKDQERIFSPSKRQRLLLSTNVAETSLTVPNIRYVVDLGKARVSRYSPRSRVQRLPIEQISQASANQRSGRCGRIAAGRCYRIYEERDFDSAPRFTEPEIRRTNLASVLLQATYFRFGSFEDFPFLDKPESHSVRDAVRLLEELGALEGERLTRIGSTMAQLPVDPRMSRMLIEAAKRQALREILIIVSALTAQDPRLRPIDRQQAADNAHKEFATEKSDFMSYLKLWDWAENLRQDSSSSVFKRELEHRFISVTRFFEWRSVHRQLLVACQRIGMKLNKEPAKYRGVHTSLLAGSLRMIGLNESRGDYIGPRSLKFRLFPGSVLSRKTPKWVMASEIVETNQTFARCVATIDAAWIVDVGHALLKYSYHDPYFDEKRGEAMILCDASLSGLTVLVNQPTRLAEYDVVKARYLFVLHSLVQPKKSVKWPFLKHNLKLKDEIECQQDRERKRDLLVPVSVQTQFYLDRLDKRLTNFASFEKWYRETKTVERAKLYMSSDDLRLRADDPRTEEAFPGALCVEEQSMDLRYRFAPGEADDGVSIYVRSDQMHLLSSHLLDWHVPGFLSEKCLALLKSIPKRKRKFLLPLQECADKCVQRLLQPEIYRNGSFLDELAKTVLHEAKVIIDPEDWNIDALNPLLTMNVCLMDDSKKVIDQDRNLKKLRRRHVKWVAERMEERELHAIGESGLVEFPAAGVPETKLIKTQNGSFRVYPTLIDRMTHIDLEFDSERHPYRDRNIRGVARLILLQERESVRYLKREIQKNESLVLQYSSLGSPADLLDTLLLATIFHGYFSQSELPRTARRIASRD